VKTVFKASFLKAIKKIEHPDLRKGIADIIREVETVNNPRQIKNLKKLSGYNDCYRIKISEYRIGIKIISDTVFFIACEHRKDIYRIFP
jgi:mRNA interferase RelE/StbE